MRTVVEIALDRAEALEPIPPITDPMGKHWEQPARSELLLDDTHVLMTRKSFALLREYSGTFPTGAYEGKMWKRHDGVFDRVYLAGGGKPEWKLVWYGRHPDPSRVSINYRLILIADEPPGSSMNSECGEYPLVMEAQR